MSSLPGVLYATGKSSVSHPRYSPQSKMSGASQVSTEFFCNGDEDIFEPVLLAPKGPGWDHQVTFPELIGLTHISSGFTSPYPLPEPMGLLLGLHTEMSTMMVDTGYTAVSTVTV